MTDSETTAYCGVAGRVLRGTMSIRSLGVGLLLGFVLIVINWFLIQAHAASFTTPLNHVVFAFVVARFALIGQYGEWEGGLFSGAGGSWVDVIQVGFRYLALTFAWLLPLILLGLRPEQMGPATMMDQKMIVLLLLYLVASILTPPAMLIVAVAAESFADMFSGQLWRSLFSGRTTDLLAVYTTYTGGMAIAVLLSAPSVIIAFAMSWQLGAFVAALAFCFLLGMSLDLLGRLCGFFALGDVEMLDAPVAELPLLAPTGPPPVGQPVASVPVAPLPELAVELPQPAAPPPVTQPKLPPLMNAKQHTDQILARYPTDPAGAVSSLRDLKSSYVANAQVAGTLAICLSRDGNHDEALTLALEALPMAFERGHSHLAADIFKEFKGQVGRLQLNREQILTIAGAAATKADLATAGEAYSMILVKDAGEMRAIKGMLQVAERILREKNKPVVAIKAYRFLEKHCAGGQFAEFIQLGIEEAERRLVKPNLA